MSPKNGKFNNMVLTGVALAGVGVTLAGSLADADTSDPFSAPPVKPTVRAAEDIELPSLPRTRAEALDAYKSARVPLSKIFRIVGQMVVAPIAWQACLCVYARYQKAYPAGVRF